MKATSSLRLLGVVIGLLAVTMTSVTGNISQNALDCICQIESRCTPWPCFSDGISLLCGYYQIREVYWIDGGKPGTDFQSCALDKACAETTVRNYLARYGTVCTKGATPTDQDYARIHNGGPSGCSAGYTVEYWNKINTCLATKSATTTTKSATTTAATTAATTTTTKSATTAAATTTTKSATTTTKSATTTTKSATTAAANTTAANTKAATTTTATTPVPTTTTVTTKAATTVTTQAPITVAGDVSQKLLDCICQVESGCSPVKCFNDAYGTLCGYHQIRQPYWQDCGMLGGSYEACALDKTCSENCVRAYFKRYGTYCTGGRTPTDQDYARIHNGGPGGCNAGYTVEYWNKISTCLSSGPTATPAITTPAITTTQAPTTVAGGISQKLLDCICSAASNCSPLKCASDVMTGAYRCGYHQLGQPYWQDCGMLGASYEACSLDKTCSDNCVRAYFKRYGTYCTGGRTPTDQDYVGIHFGGPGGCAAGSNAPNWGKVSTCLATK